MLQPKQGVTMAMALHELCTNAMKYGSLSQAGGEVLISWEADWDGRFQFIWREQGGPEVRPPTSQGFGSRLLRRAFASDFDANVELAFESSGFICSISGSLQLRKKSASLSRQGG